MNCPFCGHDNIPGIDLCESCGSDLAGLDLPEARSGFRGRLFSDRIDSMNLVPPLTVTPNTTVAEAIGLMRTAEHGCVLVQDSNKLIGIFTERDVLSRVVCPGRDPEQVSMSEVMTANPIQLSPSDPPAFAIHLSVARGLRHLPVVDGDELLGFISVRHLLRHIHEQVLGSG